MKAFMFICNAVLLQSFGVISIKTDDMRKYCGENYTVMSSSLLKMSDFVPSIEGEDCETTARALDKRGRLIMQVRDLDLLPSPKCSDVFLQLSILPSDKKLTDPPLCGKKPAIQNYVTTTENNHAGLTFVIDAGILSWGSGFTVLLTAFNNPPCGSGEFMCSNKRCISDTLMCDAWNNCGDNSDEAGCQALSGGAVAGIVLVILLGTCAAAFFGYIFYKMRKYRGYQDPSSQSPRLPEAARAVHGQRKESESDFPESPDKVANSYQNYSAL